MGFLCCWEKIGVAILQYWAWPTTEAISVSRYVDLQGPLHQRKVLYPRSVFDGDDMMAILFSQSLWFVNMGLKETHGPTKNPFWWSLAITPDSDEAHFQAGFSVTLPWTRFETALCGPLEACNIRSGLYQPWDSFAAGEKIGVAILQYWAWPTTEAISECQSICRSPGPLASEKGTVSNICLWWRWHDGHPYFSQSLWFVNMGLRETHGPTKNPFWWSLAITPDSDEAHFQAGFSVTLPWTRFETALCGPLEACNIRSGLYQPWDSFAAGKK